jgi:hypothetical protein
MPIIIPVPDPEPDPIDDEEDEALRVALAHFITTKGCPLYLRVAAETWLGDTGTTSTA